MEKRIVITADSDIDQDKVQNLHTGLGVRRYLLSWLSFIWKLVCAVKGKKAILNSKFQQLDGNSKIVSKDVTPSAVQNNSI